MILFLDDDPNRAAIAYSRMGQKAASSTIWCQTVEECITTLVDYIDVLKIVKLDHDLEGQTYVHPDSDKCGMEVIRWLEHLSKKQPEKFEKYKRIEFIIHSYNEYAAPEMVGRLEDLRLKAKWIPFGT